MDEKVGKLTVVAKTGGIKINDEATWLNPAPEVKETILKKIDDLKKNVGKEVTVTLGDDGKYTLISLVPEDVQPEIKHETVKNPTPKDEPVEDEPKQAEEPADPDASEPEEDSIYQSPLEGIFKQVQQLARIQEWNKDYFKNLNEVECKVVKKLNLTYVSWADAWAELKKKHPDATYYVHENKNGMPYFYDRTGGFVKVSVTVCGITHTNHLPIMDNKFKSIKPNLITTWDTNKTIQRCLAKAIAMHGIGIYVYRGEDLPEDPK